MNKLFTAACLAAALTFPAVGMAAGQKADKTLETTTCGNVFGLFAAADPKDPANVKNPKRAEAAQNNVYSLVMWVHGYVSGRDGIDMTKHPLNEAGVKKVVGDMVAVCKEDPKKPFLEAVKGIK